MEAYSLGRDSSQCMIERLDAERRKLAIGRHVHLRMNLPGIGKVRVVNLKNHTAVGNGSVFLVNSNGRRNTSIGRIAMTTQKRRSDRCGRAPLRSPGRPPAARRENYQR